MNLMNVPCGSRVPVDNEKYAEATFCTPKLEFTKPSSTHINLRKYIIHSNAKPQQEDSEEEWVNSQSHLGVGRTLNNRLIDSMVLGVNSLFLAGHQQAIGDTKGKVI